MAMLVALRSNTFMKAQLAAPPSAMPEYMIASLPLWLFSLRTPSSGPDKLLRMGPTLLMPPNG